MINKFRSYTLGILTVLTFLAPTLVPAIASASCTTTGNAVNSGANLGSSTANAQPCGSSAGVSNSAISKDASKLVNLFSIVVGAVSVVMIIYGGFRYITSGGDSGRVGNAKNTLIYAIVGLVIVALAQIIVHFVLNQASNVVTQQ
ncbi:MAG TPA: pilin [Candidatus Dormibacteraeota bacterium]|nr:pilin [Candidatus Dormibacteraeota bacterium]